MLNNSNGQDIKIRPLTIYIALILSLIPLFNLNIGGRGLFLYLGAGLLVIWFLLPHSFLINYTFAIYFVYVMYDMLTFGWASDSTDLIQYIKLFFFAALILLIDFSRKELKMILLFQFILGLVITIILSTTSNTMVAVGEYITDTERAILVVGGVQIDPNYAAMLMFPLIVYLVKILLSVEAKRLYKVLAILGFVLVFYSYLRAGTRGGLIAALLGCAFYFLKKKGSGFNKIILVIGIIVFIIWIFPYIQLLLPDSINRRFTLEFIIDSGGSGRIDFWRECLMHIADTPFTLLFGHGKQATIDLLGIASHNHFIDALYNSGVIGFLLLLTFFVNLYKDASRQGNLYAQALLVSYITMSMTVSVGANMYYWTGMILILLISKEKEIMLLEKQGV